jgi:hypothetical protein
MVSVLTWSVVDSGFKPQSRQTKDYEIGTLTGQKYFLTKIFLYIFHIKPLIFITFL